MNKRNYIFSIPVVIILVTSLLTFSISNIGIDLSSSINTVDEVITSPYKVEIDQIVGDGRTLLNSSQDRRLDELLEKNNQWWAKLGEPTFKNLSIRSSEQRRYLLLPLFVLWFGSIYFLIRHALSYSLTVLFLLVSPIILIVFGRILVSEFVLIYISLFLGWAFGEFRLWFLKLRTRRL